MLRKLSFIVGFIAICSFAANAGTYYSKLEVKTSDSQLGKVYVSATDANPSEGDFKDEAEAIQDSYSSSTPSHTYYLYAQPADGYVLDYWADASGTKLTSNDTYSFTATSKEAGSPTTATLTAYFIERPPIVVHSNDVGLGTASITKGTNRIGQSLTVTAAFTYTVPKGDYWNYFSKSVKFDGWYDQNDNLVSDALVYTFTVEEDLDLTAKFSWEPFITGDDGYYFIRSAIGSNGRGYLNALADYAPSFSASNRSLDGCMFMVFDASYISDPACVWRVDGTNYADHTDYQSQQTVMKNVEITSQGISTKGLTGYVFELRTGDQRGFYKLYYSRTNLYNAYNGSLTISSDQTGTSNEIMRLFDFEPLDADHIDDFYFGAQPAAEMEFDGGYWTTMYTAFPYQCWPEDGVEAFYVKKIVAGDGAEPEAQVKKIANGYVPANTAVLLKCKSLNAKENRLLPLLDKDDMSEDIVDNLLEGSLQLNSKTNDKVTFDGATMRVLSTVDGVVGFYTLEDATELSANKAWLDITGFGVNGALRIKFDTTDTSGIDAATICDFATDDNAPIYNLQGMRVKNPVPGQIYIKNGKKFVAR